MNPPHMLVFNLLVFQKERLQPAAITRSVNVLFDPHNLHKAARRLWVIVVFAVLEDSATIRLHANVNQHVFYIEIHCKCQWARPKLTPGGVTFS